MLFNSLEFVLFLPLVVAVFYAIPHERRWAWMLGASYFFYMAWEPAYGILIFLSTTVDYMVALNLGKTKDQRARRRWLSVSLFVNLGMLFSFKYYNVVNGNFQLLAAWFGYDWPLPESSLLLPVGISFYTFQTLSYTFDVYRGRQEPEKHFGYFALYVSYFPQLVAGPVERAGRLLPQLRTEAHWDGERVKSGLRLALWGLFKKVVVADRLAALVDVVYGDPTSYGGFAYAVATLFFAFQLFCDFSGYSDMAIGIARIFGVGLMKNFGQPHTSSTLAELWQRWHISMTLWFRDYIYIPLGGGRRGPARQTFNVFVVMMVSALWHGATWPMFLWGLLHTTLLIGERWTTDFRAKLFENIGLSALPRLHHALSVATVFGMWLATLMVFRAATMGDLVYIVSHLGQGWDRVGDPEALGIFLERANLDLLLFAWCLLLIPVVELGESIRHREDWWARFAALSPAARSALDYLGLFTVIAMGRFDAVPFFYFQF